MPTYTITGRGTVAVVQRSKEEITAQSEAQAKMIFEARRKAERWSNIHIMSVEEGKGGQGSLGGGGG